MRNITRNLRKMLVAGGVVASFVSFGHGAALAHDGAVGEGTDIIAVSDVELGSGIEAKWGNGEIDIHVPLGVTVVVYGVNGEDMLKIDEGGNAFANKQSVTWLANTGGTAVVEEGAEAEWEQYGTGGLRFHDHRIHFMASIPDNAKKGDKLQSWSIPMSVNGERIDVTGQLVLNVEPESSGGFPWLWIGGVLVLAVPAAAFMLLRNRD